jgi:hypothetical protein
MWQRLLLASSLLFGLLVGVAATVFAYSNRATVDVGWSVFHLYGIPLWTVAVVPVAVVLVAGTIYHWYRSLYHFTEHMRHRRRVHELEAELTMVRTQLDQLLELPASSPAIAEPVASNGETERKTSPRKRVSLTPADAGAGMNGRSQTEPSQAPVQEP